MDEEGLQSIHDGLKHVTCRHCKAWTPLVMLVAHVEETHPELIEYLDEIETQMDEEIERLLRPIN